MIIKYNNHLIIKKSLYKYVTAYDVTFAKNKILYYSNQGNMIHFYKNNKEFLIFKPSTRNVIIIQHKYDASPLILNVERYNNILTFLNKKNLY